MAFIINENIEIWGAVLSEKAKTWLIDDNELIDLSDYIKLVEDSSISNDNINLVILYKFKIFIILNIKIEMINFLIEFMKQDEIMFYIIDKNDLKEIKNNITFKNLDFEKFNLN